MNESLITPPPSISYRVMHTFKSLLTDDTGNTWTKVGSPSIKDNKLYTSRGNYIYLKLNLTKDFVIEFYNTYMSYHSYYGYCPPSICNSSDTGSRSEVSTFGLHFLLKHGGLGLIIMTDDGTILSSYNTRVVPLDSNRHHYKYERIHNTFNFYYDGNLIKSVTSDKKFTAKYLSTDCGGTGYTEELKVY